MTNGDNRELKESPLVAVTIKEGNSTTLITPNARYVLGNGGLLTITRVTDYASEVKDAITKIAEQASIGAQIYSDREVLIQIRYGTEPIKLS